MKTMTDGKAATYFAFPPNDFSRLYGPWPLAAVPNESMEDAGRKQFETSKTAGVLQWYSRKTKNNAPRARKRIFAFGAVPLELTTTQAKAFQKEFPNFCLMRNRSLRLSPRSKLAKLSEERSIAHATVSPRGTERHWHLDMTGVTAARSAGWASRGAGAKIAVVDSGIDHQHPEFRGKHIQAAAYLTDDGAGLPNTAPDGPHGTHMAALIAGATAGLAPEAELVDVQAFRGNTTTVQRLINALWFAISVPRVKVVNLSGGFVDTVPELQTVFNAMVMNGVLPICAAGNREAGVDCPANFESPITVGAISRTKQVLVRSGSSSANGLLQPDVVAPGESIISAVPGGSEGALNGTSPATAIVSGMAALRISDRNGAISLADLVAQLRTHTEQLGPRSGQGMVFYNRIG